MYSRANSQYGGDSNITGELSGNTDTRVADDGQFSFYSWSGLSTTNLNKLLSVSSASDYGIAPEVIIDLASIPAAGASGTMKMVVTLYEGTDTENYEKALSVEAEGLEWSSDGSKFTVTVPANTAGSMTLIPSKTAAGITGSFSNVNVASRSYGGGEIMTGDASDGSSGITVRLFQLFAGAAGIDALVMADWVPSSRIIRSTWLHLRSWTQSYRLVQCSMMEPLHRAFVELISVLAPTVTTMSYVKNDIWQASILKEASNRNVYVLCIV